MPIHKEKENRNSEMPGQPVMKCAGAHIYRALHRPLAAMLGYILIFKNLYCKPETSQSSKTFLAL